MKKRAKIAGVLTLLMIVLGIAAYRAVTHEARVYATFVGKISGFPANEQKAIHAAAMHLKTTDQYYDRLDQFRFTVRRQGTDWWVHVEPTGPVLFLGNFTVVHLNSSFVVLSVTGGA